MERKVRAQQWRASESWLIIIHDGQRSQLISRRVVLASSKTSSIESFLITEAWRSIQNVACCIKFQLAIAYFLVTSVIVMKKLRNLYLDTSLCVPVCSYATDKMISPPNNPLDLSSFIDRHLLFSSTCALLVLMISLTFTVWPGFL